MSIAIKAESIGIKFNLQAQGGKSFKSVLKNTMQLARQDQKNKKAKDFWALRNVSFEVNKGEILGVVGHNGAGKSTLLRLIGGIYTPDEGAIEVNGTVSTLLSLGTGFKGELSGYENIFLNGVMLGFSENDIKNIIDDIIEYSELGDFIHEPIKNYSSGMSARLGFSIAAFLNQEIMLIDEVLGVGDFKFNEKSQATMENMITDGRTVIIVSHSLQSIKKYATKAIWINRGQLMMEGNTEEVIDAYTSN